MPNIHSPRSSNEQSLSKESLDLLISVPRSWDIDESPNRRSQRLLFVTNAFLFCSWMITLFIAIHSYRSSKCTSDQLEMAWSPILAAVPVRSIKYNETFGFPSTYLSKFQGEPNKQVDEAWERFTRHPMLDGRSGRLGVPFSDISRLPKAADEEWLASVVKLDEDKYMANLEVFHTAHCLNMLRKMIYPEYYKPYGAAERGHLEHCVETIRQSLMCNSGTGLVTFHWVRGIEEPYSDYNTYHQCRDPDAVLEWAIANAVPNAPQPIRRDGALEMNSHPE
jgi:hypothetical protein